MVLFVCVVLLLFLWFVIIDIEHFATYAVLYRYFLKELTDSKMSTKILISDKYFKQSTIHKSTMWGIKKQDSGFYRELIG